MVWLTTASSSADSVSRSTCWCRRALNAVIVWAASWRRRLKRRSTACWMRRRTGWNTTAGSPTATPPRAHRPDRGRAHQRQHGAKEDARDSARQVGPAGLARQVIQPDGRAQAEQGQQPQRHAATPGHQRGRASRVAGVSPWS
jgi:hypothetical protein